MGQPVKVSDQLVLDARVAGEVAERSIAGQIEYWARLGRAVEMHLRAAQALRLKREGEARPLSELLDSVATREGRSRVASYLGTRPFPRFEAARGRRGFVVKIDEDGTRTVGRFANRRFRPAR